MQSTSLHAAIIMDGNGRWAERRGRPRAEGHRAGADRVREIVRAAPDLGIGTLTLYAFSSDNWQRPATEVRTLLGLLAEYLGQASKEAVRAGVRLNVIGRRDRLPLALRSAIAMAERGTRDGRGLWLRIAIDYSARDQILEAARRAPARTPLTRQRFAALLGQAGHGARPAPDVDLVIRTGGEHRLSDFLLWEAAYAELWFTERCWPEFTARDLAAAMEAFRGRDRRYGRVRATEGA
ncbi:MAG: polyprenyl diphosphate synthase [Gemmatimonadales bacterium]